MTDERLIVALDVHSMDEVHGLVETLGDRVGFYKVGMELFYSMGDEVIKYLRTRERRCSSTSNSMIFPIRSPMLCAS